jgi:hypothetical protein
MLDLYGLPLSRNLVSGFFLCVGLGFLLIPPSRTRLRLPPGDQSTASKQHVDDDFFFLCLSGLTHRLLAVRS